MTAAIVLAGIQLANSLIKTLGPQAVELLKQKDMGPDQEAELKEALGEWRTLSKGALAQAYEDLG